MARPDYVPNEAEDITDHGAVPNPDDPNLSTAEDVFAAFEDACDAAGDHGYVYIPEGTFLVGVGYRPVLTAFGRLQPTGISVLGAGPEKSVFGVTEHMPDEHNHNLLRYEDGYNHDDPVIRDIHLEGNYENLGNLWDARSGSRAVSLGDEAEFGSFAFLNTLFRGWWLGGVRGRHHDMYYERCTFDECAIGVNQDTDGEATGQPVSCGPAAGNTVEFHDCAFFNTSGNAINHSRNEGEVIVNNTYIEGAGSGCFKHSGAGPIRLNHVYAQAQNQFLIDNLPNPDGNEPFWGRHLYKRLFGEPNPTVEMNHVEFHDSTYPAFYDWQSPIELSGDMIAIHNASIEDYNDEAFYVNDGEEGEGGYQNTDIDRMSVHDTTGSVFNLELHNSSGAVNTLHRDGNRDGLGETDGLDIHNDVPGGQPFEPDVPSADEVGINSSGDTGGGDEEEIVDYHWVITHPDGTSETLSGETASFDPHTNGEHEIELTVENDLGLADRASDTIDY